MLVQKKDIIYGHILGYISIYLEYMGLKIKMGKEFSIKSKEILLGVEADYTSKDIYSMEKQITVKKSSSKILIKKMKYTNTGQYNA